MKSIALYLLTSLVAMTALSADAPPYPAFKQGDIIPEGHYPAAYNAPSQVRLQNDEGRWLPDVFVDASFIYYYANEGGLDLGVSGALIPSGGGFAVAATSNGKVAFQKFEYKPGFKAGIGTRFCDWTLAAEYTWIRQTTHAHHNAPDPELADAVEGVFVLTNWFEQMANSVQSISSTSISSKWRLSMDLAQLTVSRPFYEGTNLSIVPSFGVQALWLRQKLNIGINVPTQVIALQNPESPVSHNLSHSWGIGPKAGIETDCLLGAGFRLQGQIAASLLFTQYTRVKHSENVASATAIPQQIGIQYRNYNTMRPITELGLGLGWGSYFYNQKYHIDFAATYDFLWFWHQNMMRKLADTVNAGTSESAANLSLHGLTVTVRFDF